MSLLTKIQFCCFYTERLIHFHCGTFFFFFFFSFSLQKKKHCQVTPEITSHHHVAFHKHPELHVELGAFDIESRSKPGEYNGFFEDNYNRVDLAGLQMKIVQGRPPPHHHHDDDHHHDDGDPRCYMRLQTNVQLRNEPLVVVEATKKPKKPKQHPPKKRHTKGRAKSQTTPQQRFVMDMAKSVVLYVKYLLYMLVVLVV